MIGDDLLFEAVAGDAQAFEGPALPAAASLSSSPTSPGGPRPARPSGDDPEIILARVRARMASTPRPDSRELMSKILAGESFAAPGQRDTLLHKAASIVAYIEPDEDPELLAQIFDASLAHWEAEDAGEYTQEDRLKWAADKIRRSQERRRCEPDDDRDRAYTRPEIEAFATSQGATIGQFGKLWIIQKDRTYYVHRRDGYSTPVSHAELETMFRRYLRPADDMVGGVSLWGQDAKGNPKPKTLAQVLESHATAALKLEASLVAQRSTFDLASETFTEAVCSRRPVRAIYHDHVDTWLRHLGGARADKLLDWIASVGKLEYQSAALFLWGEPGTGKTMLANGLAKLWTSGGPTALSAVAGDWTEDIARCPLIFADEQLPRSIAGQTLSTYLRELIGSSKRPLKRKFKSNAELHGAIRLVLAANSKNLLNFGEERFAASDLDAVARRFLVIETAYAPREYLQSISTQGWVDGDVIAEHALWLAQNRNVTPGERFIVEGDGAELAADLATQTDTAAVVAEWLAGALANACNPQGKAGPAQRGQVLIGNGVFDVAVSALNDFWDLYVKEQKQPKSRDVAVALSNLSAGKRRRGGAGTHARRVYWRINPDLILPLADDFGLGDPDAMRAAIAAEVEDHPPLGPDKNDQGEDTES